MPAQIPEPFHPGFQYDALALLLQNPDYFREYNDCWVTELFDDPSAFGILRAWLSIYALTGQPPSRSALEHSLRMECRDAETVLACLDKLFSVTVRDATFILKKLERYSRDYNVITATGIVLDAVQAGHYDEAAALLSRAVSTGSQTIKLAGADWFETEPRLEKELIKGVLRRGYTGILNAPSKSYKTWLLLQLGIAIAEGRSWLGFKALPPARVLYLNFEVEDEEFKVRTDKVARALGTSREALKGKMDFIHLKGRPSSLGEVTAALRRLRDPGSPWELIIIDPVYRLLMAGVRLEAGDHSSNNIENNNTLIFALFCSLEELAKEFKAAIFAVHHFKKGPIGETAVVDSGVGGGVFGRAPDVVLSLYPARDEKGEVVEGAFIVGSTLRNFAPLSDFGIRRDPASCIFDCDLTLNPANIAGKAGRPQLHHIGQALSILQGGRSFTGAQWKDHAKVQYGMNKERLGLFRDEALEKEYVTASGPTSAHKTTYTLTPAGEEAILQANVTAARNGHLSAKAREVRARLEGNGNGN